MSADVDAFLEQLRKDGTYDRIRADVTKRIKEDPSFLTYVRQQVAQCRSLPSEPRLMQQGLPPKARQRLWSELRNELEENLMKHLFSQVQDILSGTGHLEDPRSPASRLEQAVANTISNAQQSA